MRFAGRGAAVRSAVISATTNMPRSRSTRVSIGCGSTSSAEFGERHAKSVIPNQADRLRAAQEARQAQLQRAKTAAESPEAAQRWEARQAIVAARKPRIGARQAEEQAHKEREGGAARCCRGGSRRGARSGIAGRTGGPCRERSGAGAPGGRCAGRARSAPRGAPGRAQSVEAAQQVDAAPRKQIISLQGNLKSTHPEEIKRKPPILTGDRETPYGQWF